jgi:6-pyruvoyltetrahydropterin/6-carboxytetrahydropterin synthase
VEGTLAEDAWVLDFGVVKRILRAIVHDLDHRFLLQRESKLLTIDSTESAWKVRTPAGIGYVLPRGDVAALPVDNTTSERLAELFAARFWQELDARGAKNVRSVTIEVWEGHGQRAAYRQDRE